MQFPSKKSGTVNYLVSREKKTKHWCAYGNIHIKHISGKLFGVELNQATHASNPFAGSKVVSWNKLVNCLEWSSHV